MHQARESVKKICVIVISITQTRQCLRLETGEYVVSGSKNVSAIDFVRALEWVRSLSQLKVNSNHYLYLIALTEVEAKFKSYFFSCKSFYSQHFVFYKLCSRVANKVDGLIHWWRGLNIIKNGRALRKGRECFSRSLYVKIDFCGHFVQNMKKNYG